MTDVKTMIAEVAPGLAGLLGGPLAGAIVGMVARAVTGQESAGQDELAQTLRDTGVTPELRAQVLRVEADVKKALIAADVEKTKIAADVEAGYVTDASDARHTFKSDPHLFYLALGVLGAWVLLLGGTLFGLFSIATGGIKIVDPGIAATVFTVLGTLVGYVSNTAQQVTGYFFGSSHGSSAKTDALMSAITSTGATK